MTKTLKLIWAGLLLGVILALLSIPVRAAETHTGAVDLTPGNIEDATAADDLVIPEPATRIIEFLSSGSNWMAASYGTWSPSEKKYGAGLAGLCKINDFAVTGLRLDYYDGDVWMPSVNFQLQAPFRVGDRRVTPFIVGGLATPLSGKGDDNGAAVGIIGFGVAVELTKKVSLVTDVEKWTRYDGQQYRLGLLYKF